MNSHEKNLMFVPIETAELFSVLVFKALMKLIYESNQENTETKREDIEQLEKVYTQLQKHKKQIKSSLR